ncbi:MAG TPA: hypothetical protein VG291_17650 [Xanthobacteraceae bacterium]|nr:hypothetical protein [Xanthobacteraceae bacterium]
MKVLSVFATMAALAATGAAAQGVNLTGQFRCVAMCAPGLQGQPAFVTQNGSNLNLLNEAGEPARAWIDWNGHIWADNWHEGALFSADGMTIQFDRGTIWQRDLGEPPPPPPVTRRSAKIAPPLDRTGKRVTAPVPSRPVPAAPGATAFDGDWSVVIMTQSGGCDRAYRYGVRISNGDVVYDGGGPVDLQGHVFSNGSVRVRVSGAGQEANGQGRLSRTVGSGTWQGQGSLGSCAGVWQAERRG